MQIQHAKGSKHANSWSPARWGAAAVLLLLSAGCATSSSTPAPAGPKAADATSSALAYYVHGCDAGQASACANAGRVLTDPASTYHDDVLLVQLRTRACDGNAYYCGDLGQMYVAGKGVQKNEERGMTFLDRACTANNKGACATATAAKEQAKVAEADKAKTIATVAAPPPPSVVDEVKDSAVAAKKPEAKKAEAKKAQAKKADKKADKKSPRK